MRNDNHNCNSTFKDVSSPRRRTPPLPLRGGSGRKDPAPVCHAYVERLSARRDQQDSWCCGRTSRRTEATGPAQLQPPAGGFLGETADRSPRGLSKTMYFGVAQHAFSTQHRTAAARHSNEVAVAARSLPPEASTGRARHALALLGETSPLCVLPRPPTAV